MKLLGAILLPQLLKCWKYRCKPRCSYSQIILDFWLPAILLSDICMHTTGETNQSQGKLGGTVFRNLRQKELQNLDLSKRKKRFQIKIENRVSYGFWFTFSPGKNGVCVYLLPQPHLPYRQRRGEERREMANIYVKPFKLISSGQSKSRIFLKQV